LLIWLVGCGCGPKKSGPGPSAQPLRQQAEAQLRQVANLDFGAPQAPIRDDLRAKAADLFLRSCTSEGDVTSCVWAASLSRLAPSSSNGDVTRLHAGTDVLVSRCLASDPAACRAFDGKLGQVPTDYSSDPNKLCAKSFAAACYASSQWDATRQQGRNQLDPEMLTLLSKACDLGDPHACDVAIDIVTGKSEPAPDEIPRLRDKLQLAASARCKLGYAISCNAVRPIDLARASDAATKGCSAGYLEECGLLSEPAGSEGVFEERMSRACSLAGHLCGTLADLVTDPLKKRDALEHGCQFGAADDCVALVKGYRTKAFAEPVARRAEALADYLCRPGGDADRCSDVKP
jgi:hypothetical protein